MHGTCPAAGAAPWSAGELGRPDRQLAGARAREFAFHRDDVAEVESLKSATHRRRARPLQPQLERPDSSDTARSRPCPCRLSACGRPGRRGAGLRQRFGRSTFRRSRTSLQGRRRSRAAEVVRNALPFARSAASLARRSAIRWFSSCGPSCMVSGSFVLLLSFLRKPDPWSVCNRQWLDPAFAGMTALRRRRCVSTPLKPTSGSPR